MHTSLRKVQILCSTAIDFKGIRSREGLHVDNTHPNYKSYKGIPIHRVTPEFTINMQEFNQLIEGKNIWDYSSLKTLLENRPNHTQFFINLFNNQKTNPFSGKIIHSTYLPYATILFSTIYFHKLNIPSVCIPYPYV